jgi:lincosamide nucleotidyltransferase A/C/D/E
VDEGVRHEMTAPAAAEILRTLAEAGVTASVSGGWAIDALLGRKTRRHDDLDLWLPAADLEHIIPAFARSGLDRLYPWGDDRPWNFVVHDGDRHRVDLHLYEQVDTAFAHYGSITGGVVFPLVALRGRGVIDGFNVDCESAEWALRWHTGYPPRAVDHHDVRQLCEHFEVPEQYRESLRLGCRLATLASGGLVLGVGATLVALARSTVRLLAAVLGSVR